MRANLIHLYFLHKILHCDMYTESNTNLLTGAYFTLSQGPMFGKHIVGHSIKKLEVTEMSWKWKNISTVRCVAPCKQLIKVKVESITGMFGVITQMQSHSCLRNMWCFSGRNCRRKVQSICQWIRQITWFGEEVSNLTGTWLLRHQLCFPFRKISFDIFPKCQENYPNLIFDNKL